MKSKEIVKLFETQDKFRHGDVIVVRDDNVVGNGKDMLGVLADGEVTGHAHRVKRADVQGVVNSLVQRAITVVKPTKVDHEEHVASPLPLGKFRSGVQAQWTPEGLRRVQD